MMIVCSGTLDHPVVMRAPADLRGPGLNAADLSSTCVVARPSAGSVRLTVRDPERPHVH